MKGITISAALILGLTFVGCVSSTSNDAPLVPPEIDTKESYQDSVNREGRIQSNQEIENEVTETEPTTKASSDDKWDEALKEYESFVDAYIVALKKVKANDLSAMNDYTELMQKAESTGKRLDDAKDQMSPEQMEKFIDIQSKMSKAVIELSK